MDTSRYLTIKVKRSYIDIDVRTIQYVFMNENVAEIHLSGGKIYRTRMTMSSIEEILGMEEYIKVHRSCLVAVRAIHSVSDKIHLNSGETLNYVARRKKEITAEFLEKRGNIVSHLQGDSDPDADNRYMETFRVFDDLPIAFADIELVFDDGHNVVDWIFRYGNAALAKLEKLPLERIVGHSFGSIFPNMDQKWLGSYERAALLGETLTIIDYSPEIDTYLHVICFPTSKGHCGCLLFDISQMQYVENKEDATNARLRFLAGFLGKNCNT